MFVVIQIQVLVRSEHPDFAQLQPLRRERLRESLGARICEHPRDLILQRGPLTKLTLIGQRKQGVVRHR